MTVSGYYATKVRPDGTPTEYELNCVTIAVSQDGHIYEWDEKSDRWTQAAFDVLAEDSPSGMTIEVTEEEGDL